MKQRRLAIMLVLALTSGLMAGYLALSFLRRQATRPVAAAEAPRGKIVVAAKDLSIGTPVQASDVKLMDWPDRIVPAGYAASLDQVVGRGVITPVAANEPLLTTKLSTKEEGGGLPIIIPEGMRGVTVKVNEVIGVAGYIQPQNSVDVLVTITPPEEEGALKTPVTKTILQNVRVLAAGQTIQKDAEGKPQTVSHITLLVTPEDGEKLTLAAAEGRIQLALRNTLDLQEVQTRGIRTAAMLGASQAAPVQRTVRVRPRSTGAPAPARQQGGAVVETIRGGERTLQTFSPGPGTR
ncbi:MAG: Flp pilus assembly protein CpaB [Gemmatimonadota bacterium]